VIDGHATVTAPGCCVREPLKIETSAAHTIGMALTYRAPANNEGCIMTSQKRQRVDRKDNGRDTLSTNAVTGKALWQRQWNSYLQKAQASQVAGDRVGAENNYQHADHYHRLLNGSLDRFSHETAPRREPTPAKNKSFA
jgi:Domain of unknown function (DUF4167)